MQVESPGGQLGIVASTPVMAAEWRVELRRGHSVLLFGRKSQLLATCLRREGSFDEVFI